MVVSFHTGPVLFDALRAVLAQTVPVEIIVVNNGNPADVEAAFARIDTLDVLVNSAGHGPRAPVLELSDEDWHQGMEVYFLCAVRPTRLVTPKSVIPQGTIPSK